MGRSINSDSWLPFFKDSEILRVYNVVQRIKTLKVTDPRIRDSTGPVTLESTGVSFSDFEVLPPLALQARGPLAVGMCLQDAGEWGSRGADSSAFCCARPRHNDNKSFLVWVNEEDHLRVISMEKGGNMKQVFRRFCLGLQKVGACLSRDST